MFLLSAVKPCLKSHLRSFRNSAVFDNHHPKLSTLSLLIHAHKQDFPKLSAFFYHALWLEGKIEYYSRRKHSHKREASQNFSLLLSTLELHGNPSAVPLREARNTQTFAWCCRGIRVAECCISDLDHYQIQCV